MGLINSGSVGATWPSPTTQEGGPMGLKEYSTVINGQATTLQLSDEDAKLQGFTKKDLVSERPVELTEAQKQAQAEEEARVKADADAKAKADAAAANKQAPAPQNKGGSAAAPKADA